MPTPTARTRFAGPMMACSIAALGLVATGCGQLVSELTATQMAGAILLSTPAVQVPGTSDVVPAQAAFSLEFASVNTADVNSGQPSQAVSPTDGAVVTLQFTNTSGAQEQVSVPGQGNGVYAVTSANSALTYVQGQTYTATITYAGTTYQLQSAPVPAPIGISLSGPSSCTMAGTLTQPVLTGCQAGSDVTVGRVPSSDTSTAFYEVSTLGSNNMPTLVTTNAPDTVVSFLEFILPGGTAPYQMPTFDVAGSNFQASSVYVVSLTSVTEGMQVTAANLGALFAGSTFLAGAAAAGIVQTK